MCVMQLARFVRPLILIVGLATMSLSKPAASARGGGTARSVRGGQQVPTALAEMQHLTSWCQEVDVVGDESMPIDLMWTFTAGKSAGKQVKRVPTGIKCKTCLLKDNSWDPIAIAVDKKRMYVLWERPPFNDGTTDGVRCIYCCKWYNGKVRKSRVPFIKLAEYESVALLFSFFPPTYFQTKYKRLLERTRRTSSFTSLAS